MRAALIRMKNIPFNKYLTSIAPTVFVNVIATAFLLLSLS